MTSLTPYSPYKSFADRKRSSEANNNLPGAAEVDAPAENRFVFGLSFEQAITEKAVYCCYLIIGYSFISALIYIDPRTHL